MRKSLQQDTQPVRPRDANDDLCANWDGDADSEGKAEEPEELKEQKKAGPSACLKSKEVN